MKKLLCVLLTVMLVLSLTACAGPLSEEITGEWRGYIYLNGEMLGLASVDSDLKDFEASVGVPVIFSFDGDDEVTIEIDGEELEVELKGDTLTIVDADNDDELEALFGDLPIELQRVKD